MLKCMITGWPLVMCYLFQKMAFVTIDLGQQYNVKVIKLWGRGRAGHRECCLWYSIWTLYKSLDLHNSMIILQLVNHRFLGSPTLQHWFSNQYNSLAIIIMWQMFQTCSLWDWSTYSRTVAVYIVCFTTPGCRVHNLGWVLSYLPC